MRTLIKTTTVMVLLLTLGLHWALLQSVAWTGMLISYSRQNPFPDAVRMTFNGEHPCRMCQAINEGRREEKQNEKLAPVNKIPLAIIWQAPVFCFESERQLPSPVDSTFASRAEPPPKPRPKACSPSRLA
jgi:hypothetical protein